MIDAKTITSLFLYGTDKKPSNVHDDELIRDKNASTDGVKIDTAEYILEGPGRFASPILFQGIEKFFNPRIPHPDWKFSKQWIGARHLRLSPHNKLVH